MNVDGAFRVRGTRGRSRLWASTLGRARLGAAWRALFETGQARSHQRRAEGWPCSRSKLQFAASAVTSGSGRPRGFSSTLASHRAGGFAGRQLLRACLETPCEAARADEVLDCSRPPHGHRAGELSRLTAEIVERAAPAYLMAVAGNADPMLGYLTTSFREHPQLRGRTGRRISTPMQRRLAELGVMDERGLARADAGSAASLYAAYLKAGGDTRTDEALRAEASKKTEALAGRGYDLGLGHRGRVRTRRRASRRGWEDFTDTALRSLLDRRRRRAARRSARINCACARSCARQGAVPFGSTTGGRAASTETPTPWRPSNGARRPRVQLVLSDG